MGSAALARRTFLIYEPHAFDGWLSESSGEWRGVNAPLETSDHHEAHAYGAYFTAGQPAATIITLDGDGDGYCSKLVPGLVAGWPRGRSS